MASNDKQPERKASGDQVSEIEKMLPVSSNLQIESFSNNDHPSRKTNNDKSKGLEHEITVNGGEEEGNGTIATVGKKFMWDAFGKETERTRYYHVWPGKNVFFFRGRLICGPDPKGFLLTSVSIILSTWVFCVFVADDLLKRSGLIGAICVVLAAIVLVNLVMVSSMDPGIIPRNQKWQLDKTDTKELVKRKRVTVINGVEVKLKVCRICKIIRPPRTCHCAICDNCVEKFDHHCPWIGQCVGLRNYQFYITFISTALVFFVYVFTFSCQRIKQKPWRTNGEGLFKIIGSCPETIALALFCFIAIWFLGGLACFHVYLIMLNQTSYENHRRRCEVDSPNPYNKGIASNIKEVLRVRLPPSRVDFRAEVVLPGKEVPVSSKSSVV